MINTNLLIPSTTMMQDTSCECASGGSDLFTTPPTDTSVMKRIVYEVYPPGHLDDGPITFNAPGPDEEYTALILHCLELVVKIVKADGNNIEDADVVGLTNFPLHSLFSQVDVHLGDMLVTTSSNTYPYNAVFEKLLTYDKETFNSQFTSELCYLDTAGQMESLVDNTGFKKRKTFTDLSRSVTLRGSLHVPILRQERHLLNKTSLKVTLTPNNKYFYMMCAAVKADEYKVKIEKAKLELTRLRMNPDIVNSHNMELQKKNAIYPIRRSVIKTFTISTGTMQETKENLFTGNVPRRLAVGLVESTAFAGNVTKNPFNFQHFQLSFLAAYVDGERYPTNPIRPSFDTNDSVEAFQTLFNGTGIRDDNRSLAIDRVSYQNGYTLYLINLSPGEPDSMASDLVQRGNVRLELKFKTPLAKTVTAIVYAEFQDQIEIDRDRNIIAEF